MSNICCDVFLVNNLWDLFGRVIHTHNFESVTCTIFGENFIFMILTSWVKILVIGVNSIFVLNVLIQANCI